MRPRSSLGLSPMSRSVGMGNQLGRPVNLHGFTGLLHWFPVATYWIVRLSPESKTGLEP